MCEGHGEALQLEHSDRGRDEKVRGWESLQATWTTMRSSSLFYSASRHDGPDVYLFHLFIFSQ